MSNKATGLIRLMVFILLIVGGRQQARAQDVIVSYQTFYDELSPYGQWIDDPEYGAVWIPSVDGNFRPYATNGYWVMTDNGNMWVSNEPWGWAAFHYGRWTYNNYYGWVWIPGHNWAPAWVSWRSGGGYYGWAPMGPGYMPGGNYYYPDNYWVFVNPQYLYQPNVYSYYQPRRAGRFVRRSSYINETYVYNGRSTYYYGPRREVIERDSHQPVQIYKVADARAPRQTNVGGNTVNVYRPGVNEGTRGTNRPTNVVRAPQPIGRPERFQSRDASTPVPFREQNQNPRQAGSINNTAPVQQTRPVIAQPSRTNDRRPTPQRVNNNDRQPMNMPQPERVERPLNRPMSQPQAAPVRQQPAPRMQPQAQPQRSAPQAQPAQKPAMQPAETTKPGKRGR